MCRAATASARTRCCSGSRGRGGCWATSRSTGATPEPRCITVAAPGTNTQPSHSGGSRVRSGFPSLSLVAEDCRTRHATTYEPAPSRIIRKDRPDHLCVDEAVTVGDDLWRVLEPAQLKMLMIRDEPGSGLIDAVDGLSGPDEQVFRRTKQQLVVMIGRFSRATSLAIVSPCSRRSPHRSQNTVAISIAIAAEPTASFSADAPRTPGPRASA